MGSILDNFLTPGERAWVASQVQQLQPSTVELQRYARTPDGMGGVTELWSTVLTCECRLSPELTGRVETTVSGRIKDTQYYRLSLPAGTDISIADRAVVDGVAYEVEGIRSPSDVEIERVAYVTEASA